MGVDPRSLLGRTLASLGVLSDQRDEGENFTPCCGKVCRLPDGREAIMWNPYIKVVCCHACGQHFVMAENDDNEEADDE